MMAKLGRGPQFYNQIFYALQLENLDKIGKGRFKVLKYNI